jgi:hypothetical protein
MDGVVVVSLLLDHDLSFRQVVEYLPIEKFIPEAAVEAFDIAVISARS